MDAIRNGREARVALDWETRLSIGGQPVAGRGPRLRVENPATEEELVAIDEASVEQVDEAVAAARRAFDGGVWADPLLRQRVMLRIADLLEEEQQVFGAALVEEVGTPISLVGPMQMGVPIGVFRYYAEKAPVDLARPLGPDRLGASESVVRYVPVGVVAAIAAYNYPMLLLALKVAPALAAGCTVVIMPSQQTPLATLMFGRLLERAGVPAGVVNIIVGGIEVGQRLTQHPDVDKVTFTGSVAVGRAVMQQAAGTLKGVTLELGGKSAAIILPDADLGRAMQVHMRYIRNAGQGCMAATRLLVQQERLREFLDASRPVVEGARVGDPWDPEVVAGPLISRAHRERVEAYVERALTAGARIAAGGGRPDMDRGWYMNPTLLSELDNGFEIARDELFGPVGVVIPYRDVDHAMEIANDSSMGLAGFVFGPLDQAQSVAQRMRAGTIYVNGGGAIRMDAPMGGFKQSGIGREYGDEGLRAFLEPQHIQWALG
jgi:aldehyde dehydrogenase (NAD+)